MYARNARNVLFGNIPHAQLHLFAPLACGGGVCVILVQHLTALTTPQEGANRCAVANRLGMLVCMCASLVCKLLFFVKIPISNGSIRTQQATPRVSVVDSCFLFRVPSQVEKKISRYKAILPTVVVFCIFACPQ